MSPDGRAGARGTFVAVVGPSGADKDTLMAHAARHPALDARVRFARRIVTRPAVAEDHDSLDEAGFARAEAAGAFALAWAAHGLRYALPRSTHADLAQGRTVVANLSRRALAEAIRAFGGLAVVEVVVSPDILLRRLVARGREGEATIRDRLRRQAPATLPAGTASHLRLDNSGDLATAVERFVAHLAALRRAASGVGDEEA